MCVVGGGVCGSSPEGSHVLVHDMFMIDLANTSVRTTALQAGICSFSMP